MSRYRIQPTQTQESTLLRHCADARLARQFDVIRVENLDITGMTRSARGSLQRPGRNIRAKAGPRPG